MQLEELFGYKNVLMKKLLTSETIVRLLNDDIKMEDAKQLAYDQVYPTEYIPETLHDGDTFIMFDVDILSSPTPTKTFLTPTLYIWVIAHRSRLKLPEGGVRTDAICSEISKLVNGSTEFGLGELHLSSVKRFAPATDYGGKVMTFVTRDFNRLHDPKKFIPKNRVSNWTNPDGNN